jgi:hypothetical protein
MMTPIRQLMMMLGLSAGLLTTPTIAVAEPNGPPGFVQFCKDDVLTNSQFTLGDCVAFVNTLVVSPNGFVPQLCDYVEEWDPSAFYSAYSDHDDCVRDGARQISF